MTEPLELPKWTGSTLVKLGEVFVTLLANAIMGFVCFVSYVAGRRIFTWSDTALNPLLLWGSAAIGMLVITIGGAAILAGIMAWGIRLTPGTEPKASSAPSLPVGL